MMGIIKPFRWLRIGNQTFRQVRMTSFDDQGRRFEKAKVIGSNLR